MTGQSCDTEGDAQQEVPTQCQLRRRSDSVACRDDDEKEIPAAEPEEEQEYDDKSHTVADSDSSSMGRTPSMRRIVARVRTMSESLKSGKARAQRHKLTFAVVQADFFVSAYCLGRWPESYYIYFTCQYLLTLGFQIVDFCRREDHYFLIDFCYAANAYILAWCWFFPSSGVAFNIAEGVCGVLAIAMVMFNNACVPHDFTRVSFAYVHFPAILAMLSVKHRSTDAMLEGMQAGLARVWYLRLWDAWSAYLAWVAFYFLIIFFICKDRIARKKRRTLFRQVVGRWQHGVPKRFQPFLPLVFFLGHQAMFLAGTVWMFLPAQLQAGVMMVVLFLFAHNGGRYYVDYFWTTYERNCAQYLDAARKAMAEEDE